VLLGNPVTHISLLASLALCTASNSYTNKPKYHSQNTRRHVFFFNYRKSYILLRNIKDMFMILMQS